MAQEHFKTPPDPKKGHGMTNSPQKNKKYSRVGQVNSEGFLAEVFHPWVRWEGPGSGFENSSGGGAGGGVWVGPSWAQVGGPTPGPSGWAHVGGPKPGPSGWAQDTQIWPPWD